MQKYFLIIIVSILFIIFHVQELKAEVPFFIKNGNDVETVLKKVNSKTAVSFSSLNEQGYKKGLLDTHLLRLINLSPFKNIFFIDEKKVEKIDFILLSDVKEQADYTFAFIKEKIAYILVKYNVKPVSSSYGKANYSDSTRLFPYKSKLEKLKWGCNFKTFKQDNRGNHFGFVGNCKQKVKISILYIPEEDNLFGLFMF